MKMAKSVGRPSAAFAGDNAPRRSSVRQILGAIRRNAGRTRGETRSVSLDSGGLPRSLFGTQAIHLTQDMAGRLAAVFRTSPDLWMTIQRGRDRNRI